MCRYHHFSVRDNDDLFHHLNRGSWQFRQLQNIFCNIDCCNLLEGGCLCEQDCPYAPMPSYNLFHEKFTIYESLAFDFQIRIGTAKLLTTSKNTRTPKVPKRMQNSIVLQTVISSSDANRSRMPVTSLIFCRLFSRQERCWYEIWSGTCVKYTHCTT